MNQQLSLFKALGDRNRMRAVAALMNYNELCACQLTELLQISGATASRHMAVLLAAGLVESRKDGRWVHYRLCTEQPATAPLLQWLRNHFWQAAELVADRKTLQQILTTERDELCRRQRGADCCTKK